MSQCFLALDTYYITSGMGLSCYSDGIAKMMLDPRLCAGREV